MAKNVGGAPNHHNDPTCNAKPTRFGSKKCIRLATTAIDNIIIIIIITITSTA